MLLLPTSIQEYILRFCDPDDIVSFRLVNKQTDSFLKDNKHIYYYCMCTKYKLLPDTQMKFFTNDYIDLINKSVSFENSFGSWQNDSSYWDTITSSKDTSWFPNYKVCKSVWWFDIRLKVLFDKPGLYNIWFRVDFREVPDEQTLVFDVKTYPKYDTIISKIDLTSHKNNLWYDVKLGSVNIDKVIEITFNIFNYDSSTYKSRHKFAFLYAVPVH